MAATLTMLAQRTPDSLPRIASRSQFDSIARVASYPYDLPHVMFVIDRLHGDRIYYVNTKRFQSHRDFANKAYLSLETGQRFFSDNYLRPERRFYMGTVSFQTPVKRWTFEFWEGDQISGKGIREVASAIGKSFFEKVAFKPNSLRQEEVSEGIPRLLPTEILPPSDYQPVSLGTAVGRLRVLEKLDDQTLVGPEDIVVLPSAPVDLPPVAGIVTSEPASPLSHISLRSKSLGVPDAYIKGARRLLLSRNGQIVQLVTRPDQYLIGKPTAAQLSAFRNRANERRQLLTPKADLSVTAIADLGDQRAYMATAYGAKSANLGEMIHARIPGMEVPDGFSLPFAAYRLFVASNGLDRTIRDLLGDQLFQSDPAVRKQRLTELRKRFAEGKMDVALAGEILRRAHTRFSGQGLFVRSSTNSEDLPNFNGAGLYSTFPNAKTDEQILQAVKFVWGSLWNFEAFEARQRAGIDHEKVFMAVLLQRGIKADSAGVMITANPFDAGDPDCCYISATKGLGIKVVEGVKIPEQLLMHYESGAVQVLTRSTIDSLLTFDEHGGVKEVAVPVGRSVLTDSLVHGLATAARRIQSVFGGKPQDIEWVIMGGKISIVQSRPYLRGT
ncbi:MAG TPA: PEP/pyruvate-binding domain-containing protein [Fimbriimonas sp.]|nr:PEP/pyruvate-binding domain-containing protein [Fimbriimonas sp.]